MNDLEKYFINNNKRMIHKWMHYFEIYDRHFSKYRNQEVTILEIGVGHGGSLQMWKHYFGQNAKIFGVDINPLCKSFEEDNIQILVGNQSDKFFLQSVKDILPSIDVFIDDGGHMMAQQIVTFEEMFYSINDNGIYLCEDLHTSYWPEFGGGYRDKNSFIEYSKNFIDKINAYHSKSNDLEVSEFTKSVNSIHYYDSILVIEKRRRTQPISKRIGYSSF